jgi:hypothetical protein
MATILSRRARTALTAGVCSLVLVAGATPAWATDPMPGSASDTVMSTGEALLVFLGIPLVVVSLIYLLVSAPGWTRGGRAGSADAWTGDPLVLGSDSAPHGAPAAVLAPATPVAPEETGGTSATW